MLHQYKLLRSYVDSEELSGQVRALSSNFGERSLAKIGKKNDWLNVKIGKNYEHKTQLLEQIYPKIKVILDCFYAK